MENITYKDIILYYVKKDYKYISNIILNISNHITNLYDNYVLTSDERKKINNLISDIINNLNEKYNNVSSKNFFINDDIINNNFRDYKINNLEIAIDVIDILKKDNTLNLFYPELKLIDFSDIIEQIDKIINFVGLLNITDIFEFYDIDISYLKNNNSYFNEINILKNILVPISASYILDKRIDKKNIIFEFNKYFNDKYSMMLGNVYQIKIRFLKNKKLLHILGYINYDSVNSFIRTSQICNDYLYNKKNKISVEL